MKKFPHIISKLFYEPLMITRERHAALCRVVEAHMAKVDMMDDEEDEGDEDDLEYAQVHSTAIIPVHGVLVNHASDIPRSSCGCGLDEVAGMIDVAVLDSNVNKLIFDFRSPGGSVTGIPETGRKIAAIVSKQTVAFTDDECCSGALWLATQCQSFYSTESASVGSIGVWCAYMDMSKGLKKEGIKIQEISAGRFKTMGAYWKPLDDEEKAMIQASVDQIFSQFKEAVNTRRQVDAKYMEGQIFDGKEAAEYGLTDGTVENIDELL